MLAAQEFLFDLNPQLLFDAALLAIAVFFLYMLMSYLLFNPARKLLKDRQDHISSELDEASADKEKAAALKAGITTRKTPILANINDVLPISIVLLF